MFKIECDVTLIEGLNSYKQKNDIWYFFLLNFNFAVKPFCEDFWLAANEIFKEKKIFQVLTHLMMILLVHFTIYNEPLKDLWSHPYQLEHLRVHFHCYVSSLRD